MPSLVILLLRLAKLAYPICDLARRLYSWYIKSQDDKNKERVSSAIYSGDQNAVEVAVASDFANNPSGNPAAELREREENDGRLLETVELESPNDSKPQTDKPEN